MGVIISITSFIKKLTRSIWVLYRRCILIKKNIFGKFCSGPNNVTFLFLSTSKNTGVTTFKLIFKFLGAFDEIQLFLPTQIMTALLPSKIADDELIFIDLSTIIIDICLIQSNNDFLIYKRKKQRM